MKTLVLGSTVLDMIVCVDDLPVLKQDVHTRSMKMALGGMAYNVYQVLHRLDCDAILGSPIGTGSFGDSVRQMLKAENIEPWVQLNMDNGCCLCLVDKNGERTFISHHGAEYRFDASWFDQLALEEIDFIYVSGLEIEEITGADMVDFLKKVHKKIVFAPGPRINKIAVKRMEELLKLNPILHLNDQEAMEYSRCEQLEDAASFLEKKTQAPVIITCGEKGAWLQENGRGCMIVSQRAQVVDTIGAGDSHAGAILACLHREMNLIEAVKVANLVAAEVVQQVGGTFTKESAARIKEKLG